LSDDDDDDDDMIASDAENTSESDYQTSRYRQRLNGVADHRVPSHWRSSTNSYTTPVEDSGDYGVINIWS